VETSIAPSPKRPFVRPARYAQYAAAGDPALRVGPYLLESGLFCQPQGAVAIPLPVRYNTAVDKNKAWTFAGFLLSIFLFGVFFRMAKSFLIPFVLALLFYFILSPILDLLTRLKIGRGVAVAIILLVTALVLYLMGILFYESGKSFAENIPKYGQKFSEMIDSLQKTFKLSQTKWDPLVWLKSLDIAKVGSVALTSLGNFLSFLANLFLVLIFLIFMLAGRGKLDDKIARSFSPHRASQLNHILERIDAQVQKYLAIKTLMGIVSGVLAFLVLKIFGVDFAIVFAFLTFLLNYIPNIGAFFSKILPFLVAIIQFGSFWRAVWIIIIMTIFDTITGMFIEPRLMGRSLGMSPLAILFALFFWGWLWGVPGMILAVPILAVVKIICSNFPELRFAESLLSK